MDALTIFRIIATEFNSIPDEDVLDEEGKVITVGVKTFLNLYSDLLSKKRFGKLYDKALAYLTAHKIKMMDGANGTSYSSGGSMGLGSIADSLRVNSVSEGETSVSFASSSVLGSGDADAEYRLTVYGIEFLTLRKYCIMPILSAGEPVNV